MTKLTSRKFALAMFALASLDVMLWHDLMADSLYVTAFIAVVTSYITGNVIQKSVTKDSNGKTPVPPGS